MGVAGPPGAPIKGPVMPGRMFHASSGAGHGRSSPRLQYDEAHMPASVAECAAILGEALAEGLPARHVTLIRDALAGGMPVPDTAEDVAIIARALDEVNKALDEIAKGIPDALVQATDNDSDADEEGHTSLGLDRDAATGHSRKLQWGNAFNYSSPFAGITLHYLCTLRYLFSRPSVSGGALSGCWEIEYITVFCCYGFKLNTAFYYSFPFCYYFPDPRLQWCPRILDGNSHFIIYTS
jgi:hypothetical protein